MRFDVIQDVSSLASLPNINDSLQVSLIKYYFAGVFLCFVMTNGSKSRNLFSFFWFSHGLGVKKFKI